MPTAVSMAVLQRPTALDVIARQMLLGMDQGALNARWAILPSAMVTANWSMTMANATLVCVMMGGKLAATVAVRIVILIAMVALLMLIVKNAQAVTQIRDGVVTCAMSALREQICAVSTVTFS